MAQPGTPSPRPRSGNPQDDKRDSPDLRLSSRIESFSDFAELEFGGYDHNVASLPLSPSPSLSPSFRGRESLVSLPTQSGSITGLPRPDNKQWLTSARGNVCQQIEGYSPPNLERSTSSQRVGIEQYATEDITMGRDVSEDRESMDIALIPAAAPVDGARPSISTPTYTDLEMSVWQEQEKAGKLSNGLGVGLKPERTIRETDLLLSDSRNATQRLSRSISLSRRRTPLSRTATRKALGQDAADRAGQAVQVIIEDSDSEDQDGSHLRHRDSIAGQNPIAREAIHSEELADLKHVRTKSTAFKSKPKRTETFFPHPDWKPFSMRYPYLAMLILISVTFAGLTEALYHSSTKVPLLSFNTPQQIKPGMYFVIKFLPTIVAVIYGVLWQNTDLEVRRLEAYYQLSKEDGATAAETLNVDYITSLSFLRPFHAYRLRHYAVTVSSIASLLAVSAVPTLTSACIILTPDREKRNQNPDGIKSILIHPMWSRMLEVVFLLIAVLGAVLFYQLGSRRSGLLADVKGIAGLAAMANVSHILM